MLQQVTIAAGLQADMCIDMHTRNVCRTVHNHVHGHVTIGPSIAAALARPSFDATRRARSATRVHTGINRASVPHAALLVTGS